MVWCITDGSGTLASPSIPLTTTTTTATLRPHQQVQSAFQTWSSTLVDEDGDYSDIRISVRDNGGPARIQTWRQSFENEYDHYDQVTTDDSTEEQRQTSPDHYQALDPAILATLRQPPAPHEYTSVSHNQPGISQEVQDTETDDTHPKHYEGLDPARLNQVSPPHEYAGISGTSQTTGSGAHDYLEIIAYPQDKWDLTVTLLSITWNLL